MSDPWQRHSAQWDRVGPPLRPCAEDLAVVAREPCGGRTLLLGSTPELGRLPWPSGTSLTAVDVSRAMLRAIWPAPPGSSAVQGDWRQLPLKGGCIDLVVGDGSCSMLVFPEEYRALSAELRRVLAPGGRVVLRVFASPPERENVAGLALDLWCGHIGNFHIFTWRLAMALHHRAVRLDDIFTAFTEICPDSAALAKKLGWSPESIATIEAYRGSDTLYSFPTLDDLRALLEPDFVEVSCEVPGYELGDRCPTLVLAAR